jgi:uncharacterized protein with PIN domain
MKTVFFRFYEELNDFLPEDKRKKTFEHKFMGRVSVKDMIESLGVPHTEIDLILVNSSSAGFDQIVENNDKISVYPEFESLDISDLQHLREKTLRIPRFVLDVHLGKLARLMRMVGLDTLYKNNYSDEEVVRISRENKRCILTRDLGILKRNEVTRGYWVRNTEPAKQLKEIINRFDLINSLKEFSRCTLCNDELKSVDKETVFERLPPKVKNAHNQFYICSNCDKIYWAGSHVDEMEKYIQELKLEINKENNIEDYLSN